MLLLAFFIAVVLLEIACLVGLILAYRWVVRQQKKVLFWTESLPETMAQLSRAVATGKVTVHQVLQVFTFLERLLPWWLKVLLGAIRWAAPLKP